MQGKDLAVYRDMLLADGSSQIIVKRRFAVISHMYKIAVREWGIGGLINPVPNVCCPASKTPATAACLGDE